MKTQFKRLHLDRLKQLAEHLTKGRLIHPQWNISVYNENPVPEPVHKNHENFGAKSKESDYNGGVAKMGNAIGECPAIFPKDWLFAKMVSKGLGVSYVPMIRSFASPEISNVELKSAMSYFQLTESEIELLFIPHKQEKKKFEGWFQLKPSSGVDEQAYNLWRFIATKAEKMNIQIEIPAL